jgi:dipeptidyl aminopeptidase/acylaminoacyl peptidase
LLATFEGSDIAITSATKDTNKDTNKVIVKVYSDREPNAYYLYDRQKNALSYRVSSRKWIDPQAMAVTETMTIKTRDNTDIYACLTKPKGLDKNLPMVVLPHGGPHGVRGYWGFDWEV